MANKNQGGIFGSIIGMLIGIALVALPSPYLLWHAQSQDRAKEFSTAEQVSADSSTDGYIVIEGMASELDSVRCPMLGDVRQTTPSSRSTATDTDSEFVLDYEDEDDYIYDDDDSIDDYYYDGFMEEEEDLVEDVDEEEVVETTGTPRDCLYVRTQKETYESRETEQCGDISSDQTVIRRTDDQCDEYGENCEPCYIVKEYDWYSTDTASEFARFSIGAYTVAPVGGANFIGTESFTDYVYEESKTNPVEGDVRYNYTLLPSDQEILVAGDAEDNEIEGAYEGKPYVISNKSYTGTLEALEMQDKAMGWILRIGSLLAMIFGMLMIVGPLTYFTNIFRAIPILGKHVDKGFDGVIKAAAVVIGIVLWLIVFALVMIVKNILIIILILAALGGITLYLVKSGKVKFKK